MYRISVEDAKKIREEMKKVKKASIYKKLQAVALRGEGLKNSEIASITGYNSNYIVELCKSYVTEGLERLKTDGRKGGNNKIMSDEKAEEFLKQFRESAEKGQVITIGDISKVYGQSTNKQRKSLSSVYCFLHREGWRLVMPQKQHPGKASDEEIESSKKLTLSWRR